MGFGRRSLKDAREAADEARRKIRTGADPISDRRSGRNLRSTIPTFQSVAEEVIRAAQGRSTNKKVRYQWDLLLGPKYCGSLLNKPIHEIDTLDIERVLRPVWTSKPETGRKLLVRLKRVFEYARVQLRDRHNVQLSNPANWQDLRDRGFERITKLSRGRQSALDYVQAPEFRNSLRTRQGIAARALEVTLLTGLRTSEVIEAKWSEINLETRTWVIPVERLKDRRTRTDAHRVPLSADVSEVLKALPRVGEYVFPGQKPGKPLSNMGMIAVLKKINRDDEDQPRWTDVQSLRPITPHGLRATFRTWGEDEGFARELLEEALGHQIGNAVERAYRRTDSFDRRRTVMNAWADFCMGRKTPERGSGD